MQLNEQQYEQLKPLEQHLDTAAHYNYVRTVTHADAVLLNEIYKQVTGHSSNITCGKCVFEICKTLGNLYFNNK